MEIEEDGKHEDKIGDFHGETLKEDRLGTRVIEIVNLLRQRTREKSREAWLRRRMLRSGRGDTQTKRRRADSPMSTPTCATIEVQRMDYLEIPLRNGKTVRDGEPVPMHFKIRAVVGGNQNNLENSDKKDRLHSDGEGLGDHASGFLALGGECEGREKKTAWSGSGIPQILKCACWKGFAQSWCM